MAVMHQCTFPIEAALHARTSSDELFISPDISAVCRIRASSAGGAPPLQKDQTHAPRAQDSEPQRDQAADEQECLEQQATKLRQPLLAEIGKRIFVDDGINLQSRQNVLTEAFAVLTMAIYLGWIHLLLGLAVASFFSKAALITFVGIWATLLIPAKLLWPWFLTNPAWVAWRRYFRFSAVFDSQFELDNTQYVIAEYPHGVFPLSQMVAVSLTKFWPNHPIYCLAADSVFYIPIWRQVMKWIGTVPATAENFRRVLKKGTVGLVPGGIAEMFMVEDEREVIKLLDRKGFVRIAVEQGAPLLPCYHFGNSQLFKWGPKCLEKAARRHRIALGLLFGRWNLPLPLPNRVPLMMAVGAPIPTRKTSRSDPEAFNAAVDEAHAQLVEAMQQLYDKYKGDYGWSERPLVIQ